ncbi:MAG: carbohydrate-binding domain-containing protein [Bacteroidales bacterium]|nr:carbohydrate-binding domain-containing protein [Bacteroidales bacterium]
MRRALFIVTCLMLSLGLHAQEKTIILHHQGSVLYETPVSNVNGIGFASSPASMVFNSQAGQNTFPVTDIDSLTFGTYIIPEGDVVIITYNGDQVDIVNPFANDGVTVETASANVTVYSTKYGVPYYVSGVSNDGSLTINSSSALTLTLHNLTLSSTTSAAVNIATACEVSLVLSGTNTLSDGTYSNVNGAFYAAGNVIINEDNDDANHKLNITGNAKHGILVDGTLTVNSGEINIQDSDSDGIHGNSAMYWNNGTLNIESAGSDGLDISGDIVIQGGELTINTSAESARGIKVSGIFSMEGGLLSVTTSGNDSKGIKCDSTLILSNGIVEVNVSGEGSNGISSDTHIAIQGNADVTIVSNARDGKGFKSDGTFSMSGGTVNINHSGDISKGIKTVGEINFSGGSITINASGNTVLENVDNENTPSYCTAIKSDTDIVISNGTFHINLPTSNHGGKSISADGSMTISGGDFTIETHGNGAAYTVSGSTKDSYTSSCLKCDGNMVISAGTFNLTSTGTGGKGINVGGTLTIGTSGGNNGDLILNVTTSGERITVTSGGGGGWPPGGGGEYANPKAIKSQGNLTIHSGTLRVNCTQSQNEGGECIESKATLTINNGDIEAYSKKDDAVNARTNLTINGGVYYVHSDANDGTDSNGTMAINGGFNISNGSRAPEEGFDCDNNQFKIAGSTSIGTGGGTSNPTSSVCTQPSVKINTQPNYALQILKSDGTVICTYQCPNMSGGGGGPGGGPGGNGMVVLFTDPQLQMGNTYTIKYGGTISGGTNTHGYYTGNVTYSGGQTTTYTVNSMFSSVNAGGNGW